MKLLCLIDNLGSGGAQRQLVTLAVGLKKRGHEVRFLTYFPPDHFLPLLQAADIPCQVISPCSHLQRGLAIRRILRQGWQDVVLAFLEGPCLYAELAQIPRQRWGLVAGERLADQQMNPRTGRWFRQGHRLADAVVCNSHTNRLMLVRALRFLKRKIATVYNTVDLELFRPALAPHAVDNGSAKAIRIVVAGSYQEKKNMMGVAKALLCLNRTQCSPPVVVDWFGAMPADPIPFNRAERFVAENGLGESLRFHPATLDIAGEYARADAVGLFSFYEGLPNVVCEGMACGKPIILSNVCDAGNLVLDGTNGFLCDPSSPESMANAIGRLTALSFEARRKMGLASRALAERLFDTQIGIERYEQILQSVVRRAKFSADCSWPTAVPESAVRTVKEWANDCQARPE
jgi:glycosyltransferase involved in cell wall biosynthesis